MDSGLISMRISVKIINPTEIDDIFEAFEFLASKEEDCIFYQWSKREEKAICRALFRTPESLLEHCKRAHELQTELLQNAESDSWEISASTEVIELLKKRFDDQGIYSFLIDFYETVAETSRA